MDRKFILNANFSVSESPETTVIYLDEYTAQSKNGNFQNSDEPDISIVFFKFNSAAASCFRSELLRSIQYRRLVWDTLTKNAGSNHDNVQILQVDMSLEPPHYYPLDYRFGYEAQLLVNERIELDHVMSCLSTLGGAFSSLGDQFLHCAKTAGKISAQQYKIAEKLGDPVTLMRCQLYLSISLIQIGRLKCARKVIRAIYHEMKSKAEDLQDIRVIKMCLGIWSKLKYSWQLERENIRSVK